jgi:hypothetical protein
MASVLKVAVALFNVFDYVVNLSENRFVKDLPQVGDETLVDLAWGGRPSTWLPGEEGRNGRKCINDRSAYSG